MGIAHNVVYDGTQKSFGVVSKREFLTNADRVKKLKKDRGIYTDIFEGSEEECLEFVKKRKLTT